MKKQQTVKTRWTKNDISKAMKEESTTSDDRDAFKETVDMINSYPELIHEFDALLKEEIKRRKELKKRKYE